MESYTAYRNPTPAYHADFPDVTVAADGSVVLVLRCCGEWAHRATFAFGRPLTFFEANAEIIVLRSTDGGASFAERHCLVKGLAYDPVIMTLSDGRLLAGAVVGEAGPRHHRSEMYGVLHRHLPQLDTVITVWGFGLWYSEDGGATWSSEPQVVTVDGWENVYNLRKPFELHDDTICMPCAIGYPWRSRYVGLVRSFDGGQTWGDPSYAAEDPDGRAHYAAGVGYWQPAMVRMPDGDLVCICVLDDRDSAPQRHADGELRRGFAPSADLPSLYRTHSVDSGFTWSVPQDTGLKGDFPSVVVHADGRLVLTATQRMASRSVLTASVSADGGVSWEPLAALDDSDDDVFYYPNTVQLPDGEMLTVYMKSHADQVRVVAASRWDVAK